MLPLRALRFSPAAAAVLGQRPQVLLQKPCMNASPHLPKDFCWAQVNAPLLPAGGGTSAHVVAAA